MTNEILLSTLNVINKENFYFMENNRKWQPLTTNISPCKNWFPTAPIAHLKELAILDENGVLNSILANSALFVVLDVENEDFPLDGLVPETEILISTQGIRFLESMNEKLRLENAGISFM